MNCFEDTVKAQAAAHTSAQPVDLIKLCYQAAFGAEHLLADKERARAYFDREYEATSPTDELLFEEISENYCRANIGAAKAKGVAPEKLFEAFYLTACEKSESGKSFNSLLNAVGELAKSGALPFSATVWESALSEYFSLGGGPVHHSEEYRQAEHPAYRVIAKKHINELTKEKDND